MNVFSATEPTKSAHHPAQLMQPDAEPPNTATHVMFLFSCRDTFHKVVQIDHVLPKALRAIESKKLHGPPKHIHSARTARVHFLFEKHQFGSTRLLQT